MFSSFKRLSAVMSALVLTCAMSVEVEAASMPTAQIGENKIKLEVSSTPEQIQRGLMWRTAMPEDSGMVFLFRPESPVRFWMKNCYMSLDMLMIRDNKIVRIFENVPPARNTPDEQCPRYPGEGEPAVPVTEVVEVNAGYAKRHGIKEGDSVKFMLNSREAKARRNKRDAAPVDAPSAK